MMRIDGPTLRRLLATLILWTLLPLVQAQEQEEAAPGDGGQPETDDAVETPATAGVTLPKGIELQCAATLRQIENAYSCTGPVSITWGQSRIQANSLTFRDGRYVEAEGNVLIVWGGNRIFGSAIRYDVEEERGIIENAMGQVLNEYLVWAKSAEKIGEKKIRVKKALVTTCSQPTPYWAFRVSRATITIDSYAQMYNVRFKISKAPLLYLPYLIWPVKDDRAAGLLFPEFGSNQRNGSSYSQALFIPLGRSADVTLLGRYFTRAGFGGGGTFRFLPNEKGRGTLSAFAIDDLIFAQTQPDGRGLRYALSFEQNQLFRNGFRMVTDINVVSDATYFSDYARDINLAASPDTLARLEFSRNDAWTSLNVREQRREQISSGLIHQALPEIEFRGRSRRLGKTPVYFAFESSFASIQRLQSSNDADYLRADLFPTLTMPFSPTTWFDISPRVSFRYTQWTQHENLVPVGPDPSDLQWVTVDSSLTRSLVAYGVDLIGPKAYRYFETADTRYKHTIETQVRYGFAESFDRAADVIQYDEVDTVQGADRAVSYALVNRLFAGRNQTPPAPSREGAKGIVLPDGTTIEDLPGSGSSSPQDQPPGPVEPVEIASVQLSQSRSFDEPIRIADTDGDGQPESSNYSDIFLSGRYNPNDRTSLDLRAQWDILFRQISGVTASGGYRNRLTTLRMSFVHTEGLRWNYDTGEQVDDSTQIRYYTAFNLLRGRTGRPKLQVGYSGSYVFQPTEGLSNFPDQSWQLRYASQCCTFLVNRLTRDIDSRRELSIRVDLTGVGKIFSSTF
jgi:lipopolysaccharide assembly outer membrane protein LptD (OstA)